MTAEDFNRSLPVSSAPARCWEVLTDVDRLAGWVGIVHKVEEIERLRTYTAVLQDRVGPLKLRADLDITVNVVEEGRRVEVRASGRDRQVNSAITVSATLVLEPEAGDGCRIDIAGRYQVSGRVAGMGAGVIKKKANKIIEEFFGHAGAELGQR